MQAKKKKKKDKMEFDLHLQLAFLSLLLIQTVNFLANHFVPISAFYKYPNKETKNMYNIEISYISYSFNRNKK